MVCFNVRNESVTLYEGILLKATWRGRPIRITQLVDVMPHPDYSVTGLFIQLAALLCGRRPLMASNWVDALKRHA